MVLRAYIDDSFEKDRTGWFVLAGFIAEPEEWSRFSSDWKILLPWAPHNKNGVREFKASAMMARPSREETIAPFTRAIDELVATPIFSAVSFREFETACSRFKINGTDLNFLKDIFIIRFCFQALLDGLAVGRDLFNELLPSNVEIDFIFDYSSESNRLIRGWNASKPHENLGGIYGKPPIFENSEECMPLQAADYLAWSTRASLNRALIDSHRNLNIDISIGAGIDRKLKYRKSIGLILPEKA
nr:DUF3800 domain-containing protein [Ancylobacter radicis]